MAPRRIALVAALACLPAFCFADGLAEAAKREQERRAKAAAACKVLDENDLKNTKGQIANTGSGAPVATRSPEVKRTQDPSTSTSARTSLDLDEANRQAREQFWRNEASRRREQLDRLERDVQRTERWSDPSYAGADAPS